MGWEVAVDLESEDQWNVAVHFQPGSMLSVSLSILMRLPSPINGGEYNRREETVSWSRACCKD